MHQQLDSRILFKNAPHLRTPTPVSIPKQDHFVTMFREFSLRLRRGLLLYDVPPALQIIGIA